jgi:hypothetical protein
MVRLDAHLLGDLRVDFQMPLFPVNGNEEFRFCQRHDHFQLFLTGVARDVKVGVLIVDDLRALEEELVNDS